MENNYVVFGKGKDAKILTCIDSSLSYTLEQENDQILYEELQDILVKKDE